MRAQAPRFGGGSLFYLSSRDGADGLWSYRDGQALEIWKGSEGALQSPAAVSADGSSVAFALRRNGKRQMHVIAADGTRLHPLSSDRRCSRRGFLVSRRQMDRRCRQRPRWSGLVQITRRRRLARSDCNRAVPGSGVVSPRRPDRVWRHAGVHASCPCLAIHPDGTPAKLPEINLQRDGERARFLPDGSGLVYMLGSTTAGQDFWLLDLGTMRSRRLTQLSNPAAMRTFDITPDGSRIVFDRLRENSDIQLIDLTAK